MKVLLFLIISLSVFLVGCDDSSNNDNQANNTNYSTERLSSSKENLNTNDDTDEKVTEEPMASFSTKISQKYPDRQNNITLACQSLNGYIVKAGETFSFCNTLGPATPEAGYKKADTFDADGNTIQAYGGGKCQVSTTLYNAVLAVPSLTVVERHEHSGPVYYVPEDMDACVSYGSCDFKFKNDNDFDIKLYFSNTPDEISVSIVKVSS